MLSPGEQVKSWDWSKDEQTHLSILPSLSSPNTQSWLKDWCLAVFIWTENIKPSEMSLAFCRESNNTKHTGKDEFEFFENDCELLLNHIVLPKALAFDLGRTTDVLASKSFPFMFSSYWPHSTDHAALLFLQAFLFFFQLFLKYTYY